MMRGYFWSLVLALIVGVASTAVAQAPPAPRDEPSTKFEKFTLAKGSVRIREYYDIAELAERHGRADFKVARAYTPGSTDFVVALQVNVEEASTSRLAPRERTGVLDADEVAGLAAALPQMGKMIEVIKQGQKASNTEGDFRGGSLKFAFLSLRAVMASRSRRGRLVQ